MVVGELLAGGVNGGAVSDGGVRSLEPARADRAVGGRRPAAHDRLLAAAVRVAPVTQVRPAPVERRAARLARDGRRRGLGAAAVDEPRVTQQRRPSGEGAAAQPALGPALGGPPALGPGPAKQAHRLGRAADGHAVDEALERRHGVRGHVVVQRRGDVPAQPVRVGEPGAAEPADAGPSERRVLGGYVRPHGVVVGERVRAHLTSERRRLHAAAPLGSRLPPPVQRHEARRPRLLLRRPRVLLWRSRLMFWRPGLLLWRPRLLRRSLAGERRLLAVQSLMTSQLVGVGVSARAADTDVRAHGVLAAQVLVEVVAELRCEVAARALVRRRRRRRHATVTTPRSHGRRRGRRWWRQVRRRLHAITVRVL